MPIRLPHCEGWAIALKRNRSASGLLRGAERLRSFHPTKALGIRSRIVLYLMLFMAFVLLLLWLFQIVFLNDFYRYYRTLQISRAGDAILSNMDNEDLSILVDRLSADNNMCVVILDSQQEEYLSSEDIRFCLVHRMSSRDLSWWCQRVPSDGTVLFEAFNIPSTDSQGYNKRDFRGEVPDADTTSRQSLLYARGVTLPDGQSGYLLINTVITPLNSTVSTLRMQLVLITVVVVLGALLMAALIARNVSRPIIETNAAARELSRGRYIRPAHGGKYREIAELNATLSRAADDLSRVESLQHELIANISHDLRTPLTMIGGYAEAMRDIPGENTPENMQIIIDETSRLSSLVNEVLDFSRLQSGSLPMTFAPFDLTSTVEGIVSRVGKLVSQDGYHIEFSYDQSVTATADEARINQVVYNLVGNALTYTGSDRAVYIHQTVTADRVRIAIRDTGKGIAEEEIPLIWNRYYRTQETHKRAIIGSGLGLSIVRSILEQHGSPYGVQSQEGEGTTFWFELPRA